MKQKLKKLLKAGWIVTKYILLAGGAVLLVLKAPTLAVMLASIPAIDFVARKTKDDIYMTMLAGAATGLFMGVIYAIVPELIAVFTAFGMYEMGRRLSQCIRIRKAQELAEQRQAKLNLAVAGA